MKLAQKSHDSLENLAVKGEDGNVIPSMMSAFMISKRVSDGLHEPEASRNNQIGQDDQLARSLSVDATTEAGLSHGDTKDGLLSLSLLENPTSTMDAILKRKYATMRVHQQMGIKSPDIVLFKECLHRNILPPSSDRFSMQLQPNGRSRDITTGSSAAGAHFGIALSASGVDGSSASLTTGSASTCSGRPALAACCGSCYW